MHEDVVAVRIQGPVEDQGRIHERTWVYKTATFLDLHFFDVEDETSIEDLESESGLTTKYQDLVLCDLIS